ncbi:MAG: hypothetical protein IKJ32_01820 [Clostridia bacterium]|nr:hypothetical protein [Clostridia bacterium]
MKLTIKSKQDYGTHIDEFNEEMECIKTELESSTLLTFQEGNIEIEDDRITYIRGENVMEITRGEITDFEMITKDGSINMQIEGLIVERIKQDKGVLAKTKYKLIISEDSAYTNELELYYE